jgi:hypothetical protein
VTKNLSAETRADNSCSLTSRATQSMHLLIDRSRFTITNADTRRAGVSSFPHRTARHSTAQYGTARHNIAQHSTAQCMAPYSLSLLAVPPRLQVRRHCGLHGAVLKEGGRLHRIRNQRRVSAPRHSISSLRRHLWGKRSKRGRQRGQRTIPRCESKPPGLSQGAGGRPRAMHGCLSPQQVHACARRAPEPAGEWNRHCRNRWLRPRLGI